MTAESNPYQVGPESEFPHVSLWKKVVAGLVGIAVLLGSATTLGIFLFAMLVLNAGKAYPSPIVSAALLENSSQKLIFIAGGIIIGLVSIALSIYVVARILKSQRLAADVVFRRQELQSTISEMQTAVHNQKKKSTTSHDLS